MLGLAFTVRAADIDESARPGEPPRDYVLRLAVEKAAARAAPGELILAADTVVVLDGDLLGKPRDEADARAMLARIAGREHTVYTGVALFEPQEGPGAGPGRQAAAVATSRVRMAPLTEEEIRWYAGTGEPLDKAGSYGVQGLGAMFVEEIFGNYTNVVGLPLPLTRQLFAELGYDLRGFRAPVDSSPPAG
jgi:septum formation protein